MPSRAPRWRAATGKGAAARAGRVGSPHGRWRPSIAPYRQAARQGRGKGTARAGEAKPHGRCARAGARPRGDAARWGHRALPPSRGRGGNGEGAGCQAAGEGGRRWGTGSKAARAVRTGGRPTTGRCGAMGTSHPTAKPRERGDGDGARCARAGRFVLTKETLFG